MYKTTVFGHKIAQDPWESRNKECGHYSGPSFINGRVFPSAVQGERTQTLQNLPVLRRQFGLWRYEVARICVQSIREEKATHKEFQQSVESFSWVFAAAAVTSIVSDSVRPHGRQPTWLPHPWDSPGKNTGLGCHFLLQCTKVKSENEVTQSCPTLSNPMDCSPPGSSVHGVFQARVLEWGAIAFSELNVTPS